MKNALDVSMAEVADLTELLKDREMEKDKEVSLRSAIAREEAMEEAKEEARREVRGRMAALGKENRTLREAMMRLSVKARKTPRHNMDGTPLLSLACFLSFFLSCLLPLCHCLVGWFDSLTIIRCSIRK